MKLKTWHIVAGGAAVGLAFSAMAYKRAAEALLIDIIEVLPVGFDINGLQVKIKLAVTNRSGFAFPVPAATVDFSINGNYVGRAFSNQWQQIASNGTYLIDLWGTIRLDQAAPLAAAIYTTRKLPSGISYSGTINIKNFQIPFGSTVAIGAIFKKKIKKYWKCNDGFFSDHNGPGACNYHKGLKDKNKYIEVCETATGKTVTEKTIAPGNRSSSNLLQVIDVPINQISIFREKFQNRQTPYSEVSVNKILKAEADGKFNFAEFDPVLLWSSPDGKKYMLSGHSRLEAFTRLCNSGNKRFCTIPAKYSYVSEAEAMEQAMRSNTLSTKETDTERALFYMKQLKSGKSYREVLEAAKETEASNAARIMAYAFLNPSGKTFVALQSLEAGDPTSQTIIRAIGQWIGEARLKFPMLTNLHEDELYNWLINGGFGKQYKNKSDFLQKLASIISQRTNFGEFDSSKPLNVFNTVTKSFAEKQFDEQVAEVRQKITELDKAIKQKSIELKQRGATEDQIFNLMQNDYGYLSRLRNQLIALMDKKSQAIDYSKQELALFGLRKNKISGHSNYSPTQKSYLR